jgi:putative tryptophan/tyrosine transport system substrate-binding protein
MRVGILMMKRREFMTLLGGAAASPVLWPSVARAQQSGKVSRVGFLGNSTPNLEANLIGPFREGLRDLGYHEGRNIIVEFRWAEGKYDRFPALIAELLAQKVDVLVTAGTPATLAIKKATSTVPLVMIAVGDPVGTKIVDSLARPGRNITGLTSISPELEAKRLELLKEVVPSLKHFAVLWNPQNAYQVNSENEVQAIALILGLKVLSLGVRSREEIEDAFKRIVQERPDALIVLADRLFLHNRVPIMDFALKNKLPGVHAYRELIEAGGLMSFGPSYADMHRRAAGYVDRILKGTKPADLPVQIPVKFELVLNLKTAKAMGLDVPATVIARADEVIE